MKVDFSDHARAITEADLEMVDNIHEVERFKLDCLEFYKISFDYLNKGLHLDQIPQCLYWLLLEDVELIEYKNFKILRCHFAHK